MTNRKIIALTRWTFIGKVMSLLFSKAQKCWSQKYCWDIFSSFHLIMLQIRKLRPECYDHSNILLYPASVYPGVHLTLSPKLLLKCELTVTQLCLTLCHPVDCSWPGSSVYGILQARILEWAAIPISRGSSWLRDQTGVSLIEIRFITIWATRNAKYLLWGVRSKQTRCMRPEKWRGILKQSGRENEASKGHIIVRGSGFL